MCSFTPISTEPTSVGVVGCIHCSNPEYLSFNFQYAKREDRAELSRIAGALQECTTLKFGRLYQCIHCERPWFFDADSRMMHRVPDSRRAIFEEWAATDTRPSDSQHAQLAGIGSAAMKAGGYESEIAIPCLVRNSEKEWDPALVMITKVPPVVEYYGAARLLAPNDEIVPTKYALSVQIRQACLQAQELRMGFAPTAIENEQSHRAILNWGTHVYRSGIRNGEDYRLSSRSFSFNDDRGEMASSETEYLTYFYADWYDRCAQLRKT